MDIDDLSPDRTASDRALARWGWPALVVALALVAMRGLFSTGRVFYDRDLGAYYWPLMLWFRREVWAGGIPLWDPYMAFGQSAIAEPIRQMLFVPTLPLRLLLPDVVGFNLTVAAPFAIAAIGAYLFFGRHVSREAAALAAIAFVLSGALLSLGNMLNNSTTASLVPWVLWATDRIGERTDARRIAVLAVVVALQTAAGEPVTLACTAALAAGYAALGPRVPERGRLRYVAAVAVGGAAGAALAAVQLLPLVDALGRSKRGTGTLVDGWSVHPLMLLDALAPSFWGDLFVPIKDWSPWINPLNSNREPYLKSIYLGIGLVAVAVVGAASGMRRWAGFWGGTLGLFFVLALGYNTPIYAFLRGALPLVETFRYPAKYFVFVAFAVAALAAVGWDAIRDRSAPRAVATGVTVGGAIGGLGAVGAIAATVASSSVATVFASIASAVGVAASQIPYAAALATESLAGQGARLAALGAVVAATLWLATSSRPLAPRARAGLFALLAIDMLAASADLNPTLDASLLRPPAWTAALGENAIDRVYVGRDETASGSDDAAPLVVGGDPETSTWIVRALYGVAFVNMPSGWGVRESMSRDMVRLRSADYWEMASRFHDAPGAAKARYLARTATRYYVLPFRPEGDYRLVEPLAGLEPWALYELTTVGPRAYVVPGATLDPDLARQTARMMSSSFDPYASVLLAEEPPAPAGSGAAPAALPAAEISAEATNEIVASADVPEGGGFLVLMDSYEPGWRAEVDGESAPILRADGLFRAVRLAPGRHEVRFVYRPTPVLAGLAFSVATALLLVALAWRRRGETG